MSQEHASARLTGSGWANYLGIPDDELEQLVVPVRRSPLTYSGWYSHEEINGHIVGEVYEDGIYSGKIIFGEVTDNVNHPTHYTSDPSGVECIEITRHRNFNIGNAIKYLWRAGLKKSGSLSDNEKEIEDLQKAIFYINDEIALLRGEA